MTPKAKWKLCVAGDVWRAEAGPFRMEVTSTDGECLIQDADSYAEIWFQKVATPCDAPDLMRLCEGELARRLQHTAETMDGSGLVAAESDVAETWAEIRDSRGQVVGRTKRLTPRPSGTFYGKQPIDPCTAPPEQERPRHLAFSPTGPANPFAPGAGYGQMTIGREVVSVSKGCRGWVSVIDKKSRESLVEFSNGPVWVHWSDLQPAPATPETYALSNLARHVDVAKHVAAAAAAASDPRLSEWPSPSRESARFKVGDLVRGHRSRMVGVVQSIAGWPDVSVRFVNADRVEDTELSHVAVLDHYTLPPITSYSELADVLDELPEGCVVKMDTAEGWFAYQRVGGRYASRTEMSTMSSTRQAFVSAGRILPGSFSVLPPEAAK